MNAEPIVLHAGAYQCAGLFHAPSPERATGHGVLICPPWGWDEVASYRPRRRLAEWLARVGHSTLRFDLPATGDSTGDPGDPALVESWLTAIDAGIGQLRRLGAERVALVGLGLGGLLVRESVRRGAPVEDMVIWGAPTGGRAFVREIQAFARLQTSRGDGSEQLLAEGWREVGGYVISAETLAALKAIPSTAAADSGLQRALLLDRDGVGGDDAFIATLRKGGVEVSAQRGNGWSGFANHPELSALPDGIGELIEDWLAEAPASTGPEAPAAAAEGSALALEDGVTESPFIVRQDFGNLFGVLASPSVETPGNLCAVLLNAGAIHHAGPNRMWVETARRWAAAGVPTLRLDLEGIGEADGDEWRQHNLGDFYGEKFVRQVVAALDALEERGVGATFLCGGLCTGAYWSARAAITDPRVEAAVMLNGGALAWHERLAENRQVHRFNRVFSFDWWRRLVLGGLRRPSLGEFATVLRARLRSVGRSLRRLIPGARAEDYSLVGDLDRLRDNGTSLVLAFSGGEALAGELAEAGVWDRLDEWPGVSRRELPGNDHTLRSIRAQRAASGLLDAELDRLRLGQPVQRS